MPVNPLTSPALPVLPTNDGYLHDLHYEIVDQKALQHIYSVQNAQLDALEVQNEMLMIILFLTGISAIVRFFR